ncbi:Glycosyltransferase involved in cell wall bisynthesis [Rhizobiales bacterium GAS191]|nr:Glycosyltransferase involved in cell wall bisynthesis [Rhizobiales bacterium GAS113]SEB95141.1 Glycosyltransferase involved in cell wall bisynthesis [Rhizobiales bacterium GAS191]
MTQPQAATLIFIVTEDWFFASHFLPMLRSAREAGFAPAVICRVRAHRQAIEAAGGRVIALEADRGRREIGSALATIGQIRRILRVERPAIVHLIALWPIALGGIAAILAGVRRRVYAVTGLGFLGASPSLRARSARMATRLALRVPLDGKRVRFLLENPDDAKLLGFDPAARRVVIVGGAGVDPQAYGPSPLPPLPPLKIAVVARMLWSKGIDVAVAALRLARQQGADIILSLYGEPDPTNPKTIPQAQLEAWDAEPGIAWRGRTNDAAGVWREHHVCCLPSRGGEGLPRTLLEGASCGRAVLTSDVPGCRALVRDGVEGLLVPPGDAPGLARAMLALAQDPQRMARMGEAARARVLSGFTEQHVIEAVAGMYRELGDS